MFTDFQIAGKAEVARRAIIAQLTEEGVYEGATLTWTQHYMVLGTVGNSLENPTIAFQIMATFGDGSNSITEWFIDSNIGWYGYERLEELFEELGL